jgi:catechol 2,3-dioxygenase-like lactoylglutathione lyase family enzyme
MSSRAHVSLHVSDLSRAVTFYQALFGQAPARHERDWAKFELDDPALVLSLEPVYMQATDSFDHLGVRLASAVDVDAAHARLLQAGLVAAGSACDDVECCYSTQRKLWLTDPDRNLWEVYALTGALDHRGDLTASEALAARARGSVARSWEHKLGASTTGIPHDATLDEVRLRGSLNDASDDDTQRALFDGAFRALRPGGRVAVHGLFADAALDGDLPRLPGPAALVRAVPHASRPLRLLFDAGFRAIFVEKLSERAVFRHRGVGLREVLAVGVKPFSTALATASEARVVYKGPFREVVDDAGHKFERGVITTLSSADADLLKQSALASSFAFLDR